MNNKRARQQKVNGRRGGCEVSVKTIKLMNGVRVIRRAKSKIKMSRGRLSGSVIVTDFSAKSRKPTPEILSTQKIESRIEISAASTSRSAIVVLISKVETIVDTKSLMKVD